MTFSLVGRCEQTGMLGTCVTSSSPAVAARCAWARAGVGAACTQNITDPRLGPGLLDLLAVGHDAQQALDEVVATAEHVAHRQLTLVDATGRTAVFSGEHVLGRHATRAERDCAAAGNLLADDAVPVAMVEAFRGTADVQLGERLVAALRAGRDAGGEEGPVRSAGIVVVDAVAWPVTDLRVDWDEDDPIERLAFLWEMWRHQADDYVTRALDPRAAPSFGVPGDA
ncbi:MAG: DUF1028 domain-containing protein [Thermoleophilia bacterium]|nr:DUF1028 domain-containing protein [Thermoleophilia bacterium]